MIGLVDCNNFFVSCERIFRPDLINRPVVVLSNNDGCVVALSEESKALGIRRGTPYYQIKDTIKRYNIEVFSGNHRLYSDISTRVMATISSIVPNIEITSIDEAFLDFEGIAPDKLPQIGALIVKKTRRDIGIPVSLGIANTKTLAKVAAYYSKRYRGYSGVCIIDSEEKRCKALSLIDVRNVWGIGRKLVPQLNEIGVRTAGDFANLQLNIVKQKCNIVGERTWRELNNEACITSDADYHSEYKQMCSSRSFSHEIYEIENLSEAISAFVSSLAYRLRTHNYCAVSLSVFIHTNTYNTSKQQYCNSAHFRLEEPTNDTLTLTAKAIETLHRIFRNGFGYKKAGIIITEIIPANEYQLGLFTPQEVRHKKSKLMTALDKINLSPASTDIVHPASHKAISSFMRQEHISRQYTTNINEIITINCRKKKN